MTPMPVGIVASAHVSASWTPADLADLVAWWDASDADSFTYSSGTTVQQWNDLSGNGYHLLNDGTSLAGKATKPERDVTVNGLSAVRFDGSMNIARGDTANSVANIAWPATAWAIMKMTALGGVLIGHLRITLRGQTYWALDSSAGLSSVAAADTTGPHCLVGVITSDSAATLVVDGTSADGDAVGVSTSLRGFMLGKNAYSGAWLASGAEGSQGYVCETGVTSSAMSTDDRAALLAYAQDKWGTP